MIKFNFPSLTRWVREDNNLSSFQKMKFDDALKRNASPGTDDLFHL